MEKSAKKAANRMIFQVECVHHTHSRKTAWPRPRWVAESFRSFAWNGNSNIVAPNTISEGVWTPKTSPTKYSLRSHRGSALRFRESETGACAVLSTGAWLKLTLDAGSKRLLWTNIWTKICVFRPWPQLLAYTSNCLKLPKVMLKKEEGKEGSCAEPCGNLQKDVLGCNHGLEVKPDLRCTKLNLFFGSMLQVPTHSPVYPHLYQHIPTVDVIIIFHGILIRYE